MREYEGWRVREYESKESKRVLERERESEIQLYFMAQLGVSVTRKSSVHCVRVEVYTQIVTLPQLSPLL